MLSDGWDVLPADLISNRLDFRHSRLLLALEPPPPAQIMLTLRRSALVTGLPSKLVV